MDKTWAYISMDTVKNDAVLVDQARENLKYQLYTFANSAILNISTERVQVWWDTALKAVTIVSGTLTVLSVLAWLALSVMPQKKKEEE